jgi:pyruvate dehydrogenase E1 component beta subunit
VATAGTPADIRAVLAAAIASDDPVIVMEPLSLYAERAEVPNELSTIPLGTADIKRRGDDVTIVTWGAMVPRSLEAAEALAGEGVGAEVVDLLTVWPWDVEAVLASAERTGRVVVAHQASRRGGFGAEIAATVGERLFGALHAPVARVGALNVPVPFSPPLEGFVLPNAARVAAAVRAMR